MATLSPGQIALFMQKCGWGPPGGLGIQVFDDGTQKVTDKAAVAAAIKWYDMAIAVCLAESGGNTQATNGNAKGLWQIMTSVHGDLIKQAQAYWVGELGLKKLPTIYHPLVNTEVAHRLYNERQWQPWEVVATGAYKKHLGKGKRAYNAVVDPKRNNAAIQALIAEIELGQETAAFAGLAAGGILLNNDLTTDPVSTVLAFLKSTGVTIGVFLLGVILFAIGVWILLSQTKAGELVRKVTPLP